MLKPESRNGNCSTANVVVGSLFVHVCGEVGGAVKQYFSEIN